MFTSQAWAVSKMRIRVAIQASGYIPNAKVATVSLIITPLFEVIYLFVLGSFYNSNGEVSLGQARLLISGLLLAAFSLSANVNAIMIMRDRLVKIYSVELIHRKGVATHLCYRLLVSWLCAQLVFLLLLGGFIGFSLVNNTFAFDSIDLGLVLLSSVGICLGGAVFALVLMFAGLYLRDPFALLNLVLPFIVLLYPVVLNAGVYHQLWQWVLYLLPGGALFDLPFGFLPLPGWLNIVLQSFTMLGWIAVALLILRLYQNRVRRTGSDEGIY